MGPLTAQEAAVEAVIGSVAVAVEESFNADAPDTEPRVSWEAESEEWEPVASEELLTDDEAFVAEPAAEVEQPSAEEDAEPWFVADVQEPAAPAEPTAPQTDTWSGRADRLVVPQTYVGTSLERRRHPAEFGCHRRSSRSPGP